jgi:lysine-N-methylase
MNFWFRAIRASRNDIMTATVQRPTRVLQTGSYEAFRCIGAACEDTCCYGWAVVVDKSTYEKYQHCEDAELKPRLAELVTLNTTDGSDEDYARIKLSGSCCTVLSEGLCTIHQKLGEEYLSKTCLTYPRVVNQVDEVLQRSLHLSCPEAARLVLLDPKPMEFHMEESEQDTSRVGNLAVLDTSKLGPSGQSYRYFREVQEFVIALLQTRAYFLWQRLIILGYFCDRLTELAAQGNDQEVPPLIQGYIEGLGSRLFDDLLSKCVARPVVQLETVLELIVGRISSDFTSRRFLDCYEQFMHGMRWIPESSMDDIASRYTQAYSQYYAPFMTANEHMLENYVVNYAYKTLFPFGSQAGSQKRSNLAGDQSANVQYALMIANFAIVKAMLIGLAGHYQATFNAEQVVRAVQACAKTFEHSFSYPARVMELLAEKGMDRPAGLAVLIVN